MLIECERLLRNENERSLSKFVHIYFEMVAWKNGSAGARTTVAPPYIPDTGKSLVYLNFLHVHEHK